LLRVLINSHARTHASGNNLGGQLSVECYQKCLYLALQSSEHTKQLEDLFTSTATTTTTCYSTVSLSSSLPGRPKQFNNKTFNRLVVAVFSSKAKLFFFRFVAD